MEQKFFPLHNSLIFKFILAQLWWLTTVAFSQQFPHHNAHAHNDYEHTHPLRDALQYGFSSVEADVHLRGENLVVAHNRPTAQSLVLEKLYLRPLDSILIKNDGHIYPSHTEPFYLMIDIKTDAEATFKKLKEILSKYPALTVSGGPVRIFLSGNRPMATIQKEGYHGIGIDGRPDDLGKGYSLEVMPVISDHFRNWSHWNGKSSPTDKELIDIKALVTKVHGEGKLLRLWSIPDNELAWEVLLNTGVDFINTDHLEELSKFLSRKGL